MAMRRPLTEGFRTPRPPTSRGRTRPQTPRPTSACCTARPGLTRPIRGRPSTGMLDGGSRGGAHGGRRTEPCPG
uniref:Uncharacterized protein n=1 Tax=Setaria viridis TaxID=4556 RepID=A0A4U6UPY1_SETVI|nr:hypothetical protein SEVIR_5G357200v2 [Setaria viridis]